MIGKGFATVRKIYLSSPRSGDGINAPAALWSSLLAFGLWMALVIAHFAGVL